MATHSQAEIRHVVPDVETLAQRLAVVDYLVQRHKLEPTRFIAVGNDPTLGDSLCEVGIQFSDDFIEWSVNFSQKPFPDACNIAKELARQSIANSK